MKKIIFCFAIIFFSISLNSLNANEKVNIKKSNDNHSISFSQCFREDNSSHFSLLEKNEGNSDNKDYEKLSKNMFGLGIGGAIGSGLSLLLAITGAIFTLVGWDKYWNEGYDCGPAGRDIGYFYMHLVGLGFVGAFASLLYAVFLPMAIIGFVLWYIFSKKADRISTKSDNDIQNYGKLSKDTFRLGIVGIVGMGASLLLAIAGGILIGLNFLPAETIPSWWSSKETLITGIAFISISGLLIFSIFLPILIVGFVLSYKLGKKAGTISMYMENRQGIFPAGSSYQNNPALGLKFSF